MDSIKFLSLANRAHMYQGAMRYRVELEQQQYQVDHPHEDEIASAEDVAKQLQMLQSGY